MQVVEAKVDTGTTAAGCSCEYLILSHSTMHVFLMTENVYYTLTPSISGRADIFGSTHFFAILKSSRKDSEGQSPACSSTLVHRMLLISLSMSASINEI